MSKESEELKTDIISLQKKVITVLETGNQLREVIRLQTIIINNYKVKEDV